MTETEREMLAQAFWDVRRHKIAGAYLPVGQLDGDCRECGQEWPCSTIQPIFDKLVAKRLEEFDDAVCDALCAAKSGKYDGMDVETHLKNLIKRLRVGDKSDETSS